VVGSLKRMIAIFAALQVSLPVDDLEALLHDFQSSE
jgi:hypothetical protein